MKINLGAVLPGFRRARLVEGMCKLHDVLADTPMHNKYWICGGALLGWAREGALLKHDPDVDFHFWREDLPIFLKSIPALQAAGFAPDSVWVNAKGRATEYRLKYKLCGFEFFEAVRAGKNTQCTFYGGNISKGAPVSEIIFETPGCELAEFEFYGRTWLKPADHEAYLRAQYGDWKTPDKKFESHRDSRAIVSSTPIAGKQPWPKRVPKK